MPGKILQNMTKVGVRNPLFLLDEVDKMGMDFRGDPSSALLEVLDPEQNHTFVDHYVEVEYDLSDVMFVATANTLNIPAPLLDRMEVIRLSGYTEDEKIAHRQAVPAAQADEEQRPQGGRAARRRERAARHRALLHARGGRAQPRARDLQDLPQGGEGAADQGERGQGAHGQEAGRGHAKNLDKYLGVRRYTYGIAEKKNQVGQVTGPRVDRGRRRPADDRGGHAARQGQDDTTGKLGEVMQESIEAALSVVRHRARSASASRRTSTRRPTCTSTCPRARRPRTARRAGIAIATAIVSVLTGIPVRCDVAMTGEITLRGEVLPIGGLKEKLLAAHRGGIKTVLIPEENVKDLAEIPDEIKNRIEIRPVRWIDQVLDAALERQPVPLVDETKDAEAPVPPRRRRARIRARCSSTDGGERDPRRARGTKRARARCIFAARIASAALRRATRCVNDLASRSASATSSTGARGVDAALDTRKTRAI